MTPDREPVVVGFDAPGRGRVTRGALVAVSSASLKVVARRALVFDESTTSEVGQYREVYGVLDAWAGDYFVLTLAVEQPFLHAIAQWIGVLKGWAVLRNIPWYMITASAAKKAVLGDGRVGKAAKKVGRDAKADVRAWATERAMASLGAKGLHLAQHEADAILYATAVILKSEQIHAR